MNRKFLALISFVYYTVRREDAKEIIEFARGISGPLVSHPRESLRRIPVWFQSLGNSSSSVSSSLPLRSSFSPHALGELSWRNFYDRSPTLNLPCRFFYSYESVCSTVNSRFTYKLCTFENHEFELWVVVLIVIRFSHFLQDNCFKKFFVFKK